MYASEGRSQPSLEGPLCEQAWRLSYWGETESPAVRGVYLGRLAKALRVTGKCVAQGKGDVPGVTLARVLFLSGKVWCQVTISSRFRKFRSRGTGLRVGHHENEEGGPAEWRDG